MNSVSLVQLTKAQLAEWASFSAPWQMLSFSLLHLNQPPMDYPFPQCSATAQRPPLMWNSSPGACSLQNILPFVTGTFLICDHKLTFARFVQFHSLSGSGVSSRPLVLSRHLDYVWIAFSALSSFVLFGCSFVFVSSSFHHCFAKLCVRLGWQARRHRG